MEKLFFLLGACFLFKGIMFLLGKGIPPKAAAQLAARGLLHGWRRGTGAVHILWGAGLALIGVSCYIPGYTAVWLALFAAVFLTSILISIRTAQKYSLTPSNTVASASPLKEA